MRGTAEELLNDAEFDRITPAHAGNSLLHCTFSQNKQDHPRSCGEQPGL